MRVLFIGNSHTYFNEDVYKRQGTDSNGIEDIVQETFIEAYRKANYLRTHPNLPGWLRLTAKNKVMKWEEKQRKYNLDFNFMLENSDLSKSSGIDEFQMAEAYSTVCKILSKEELALLRAVSYTHLADDQDAEQAPA